MKATAEIIQQDGWPALRVEDLARRAELSVGDFYLYFEGKDDLFVSLVVAVTESLQSRRRRACLPPGTPVERLARALDVYLDFVTETEPGLLYFLEAGNVQTIVGPLSAWAIEQHANDLRPVLEQAMAQGEIHDEDPRADRALRHHTHPEHRRLLAGAQQEPFPRADQDLHPDLHHLWSGTPAGRPHSPWSSGAAPM